MAASSPGFRYLVAVVDDAAKSIVRLWFFGRVRAEGGRLIAEELPRGSLTGAKANCLCARLQHGQRWGGSVLLTTHKPNTKVSSGRLPE